MDIRCNVEATGGSVYNANSLSKSELDLGIVQSDIAYQAWNAEGPFKKKIENLSSLFSIHAESLTLVARKDSGIKKLADLKNKKVNIGNPGSGTRRTVETLFGSCGLKSDELKLAGELKPAEMPDALRDKKLDAYFYTVGHPTANVKDIATSTDILVIPLNESCVKSLVEKHTYYVETTIPGGLYRGNEKDIPSFGVKATLLASNKLSKDVAYEMVKSVFEDLTNFRQLHPSYKLLTKDSMLKGLSAPLHPGAKKYFEEKGLLEEVTPSKKPVKS